MAQKEPGTGNRGQRIEGRGDPPRGRTGNLLVKRAQASLNNGIVQASAVLYWLSRQVVVKYLGGDEG